MWPGEKQRLKIIMGKANRKRSAKMAAKIINVESVSASAGEKWHQRKLSIAGSSALAAIYHCAALI